MDQWREVVGYEGKYQVSETGDVWSHSTHKYLEPLMIHGYLYCRLWNGRRQRNVPIHRIVAETFIENPDAKPWINHKDGNILNNHMSNLEWVSPVV